MILLEVRLKYKIMKREDIEKAAKDYTIGKTHFRRNVLKEVDADDYALRKDNCREDFMAGAEWSINSAWHDASETPQHSGMLIAIKQDETPIVCGPNNSNWKIAVRIFHIVRWAYIENLLPITC